MSPDGGHVRREKYCYAVFLLGSSSYLPGILVLAHSMRRHGTKYPLIVLVTEAIPSETVALLQRCGLDVRAVDAIEPPARVTTIAERFVDTWTKVQVFGLTEYDRVVLIDGDMMLRRRIDELFDIDLPPDWIACAHGCICNLDRSWWAPDHWRRENCGYTGQRHPSALVEPAPAMNPRVAHTPYLLNSGLIVLRPSPRLHRRLLDTLTTTDPAVVEEVSRWMFPDQDFIGYAFADRWISLPWVYNAIKISRLWHGDMWRDAYAANVHYICDKPWHQPPSLTPAGQLDVGDFAEPTEAIVNGHGDNAVTHAWWWQAYYEMRDGLSPPDAVFVDRLVQRPDPATEAFLRKQQVSSALPIHSM